MKLSPWTATILKRISFVCNLERRLENTLDLWGNGKVVGPGRLGTAVKDNVKPRLCHLAEEGLTQLIWLVMMKDIASSRTSNSVLLIRSNLSRRQRGVPDKTATGDWWDGIMP